MVVIIGIATVVFTLLGGLLALRFKDKLHLIMGFSAGVVIGVAFFDLLPEAIELGSAFFEPATITSIMALGFLIYLMVDRYITLHFHDDEDESSHHHRGTIGASSISLHRFLDGLAIGLAFQVSAAVGAVVATAVLVHHFSDGINMVNMVLKNKGESRRAFHWLLVGALAPALGAFATLFFQVPEQYLGPILALFCGFFLYIGASDLIPESHHRHPTMWTTFMTVLGVAVLFAAVRFAPF